MTGKIAPGLGKAIEI